VIQYTALREQIDATENVLKLELEALDIMKNQNRLGEIAESNVVAQEAVVAQTMAGLPSLYKQRDQKRNQVAILLGKFPSEFDNVLDSIHNVRFPEQNASAVASDLLRLRPDVKSAESLLHEAAAAVGVAEAARFPSVTISADAGSTATELNHLFQSGNGFWLLSGNLVQPIFSGGALLHQQRAAEAGYEQAMFQYKNVVLNAFQNTVDSLTALAHDADAYSAAEKLEQTAKRSVDMMKNQVSLGEASYLSLIIAEQTYLQAVVNLAQARADRLSDAVALYQSLGGRPPSNGQNLVRN
ncbi:MAG TPA: efflux transporter outer membrane subunit, partial [Pseudomonadales bacterium]|nr:efflux transporter outer membrane subunit [Pseudomonadales bacterium]